MMNEQDGFRLEAAMQFGFSQAEDDGPYTCTEAQLIAFAKACERKGLAEAVTVAAGELRNTSQLMSNPPQSSAAWDIRNALNKKIEKIDAELAPILAAEEERYMTSRGYVRGTDEPGKRWVKPPTVASALAEYLSREPCEYCGPGKYTGLPGNACENCRNTGLKNPTAEDLP